ncbi:MAG: hypothetical protein HC897_15600 [Thermoanaerobaculia bacterium]|nr:hypothetical protein [Thermoanaerobaculia bacterium]
MQPAAPEPPASTQGEPVDPSELYSEDGVDLSLIRWMLSLTPGERLQFAQDFIDTFWSAPENREA